MQTAKLTVVTFDAQDVITTSDEIKGYFASWGKFGEIAESGSSILYDGTNFIFGAEPPTPRAVINIPNSSLTDRYSSVTDAFVLGNGAMAFNVSNLSDPANTRDDFEGYTEITDASMMQEVFNWLLGKGLVEVR